jgi:hypothetical protein
VHAAQRNGWFARPTVRAVCFSLYYDAVSNGMLAVSRRQNDVQMTELGVIWKAAVTVLSRQLFGGREENDKNLTCVALSR